MAADVTVLRLLTFAWLVQIVEAVCVKGCGKGTTKTLFGYIITYPGTPPTPDDHHDCNFV